AWMRAHPMRVEQRKPRKDQGKYLNPELFGAPRSAAIHALPQALKPLKGPTAPKAPAAGPPPARPKVWGRAPSGRGWAKGQCAARADSIAPMSHLATPS